MNQFPAIERRVAQHCSHPHLEEAILAALAAEDKNLDQVRQASSATSVLLADRNVLDFGYGVAGPL